MRITICIVLFFQFLFSQAQNALVIPPTLSGTNFNLNIQEGTTQFVAGINKMCIRDRVRLSASGKCSVIITQPFCAPFNSAISSLIK